MSNITPEQAAEMQSRVERLRKASQFIEDARNTPFVLVEKRTQTPHSERNPKTATTVGAKPERETGAAMARPQAKKSKYGNKRVQIDGIWFDSILEGHRYGQLKLLRQAGEIVDFEMQVVYHLDVNGIHICDYRADFVVKYPDGHGEVEDTKGVETPEFKLKKKLMLAIYGIKIVIIRRK